MSAVQAVYTIKTHVSSGPALTRNLTNPVRGDWYRYFELSREVQSGGPIHEAMKIARGDASTLSKARARAKGNALLQPGRTDLEDLPWPLSVPWPGSFLTSNNIGRDFSKHAMFATIEAHVVSLYRLQMIEDSPAIGNLRDDLVETLSRYLPEGETFSLPDGIATPEYDVEMADEDVETMLKMEKQQAVFTAYETEILDMIKYCSKKKVLLAAPGGSLDNERVRKAFGAFIEVSLLINKKHLLTKC